MNFVSNTLACIAFSLVGCTTVPTYTAPTDSQQRAAIKFEYHSIYPISTGQVLTFEGQQICNEPIPNPQKLFVRGRGNPLISDINSNGTYAPAGKELNLHAIAITSASALCFSSGAFTPKAGASYTVKLSQVEASSCVLEILEGETLSPVQDFKPLACQ